MGPDSVNVPKSDLGLTFFKKNLGQLGKYLDKP